MRASKVQNGCHGVKKWLMGSRKRSNLRLLDPPINFNKISFLIRLLLLREPQNKKCLPKGPKMAGGDWTGGLPIGFWALLSTFAKKIFI